MATKQAPKTPASEASEQVLEGTVAPQATQVPPSGGAGSTAVAMPGDLMAEFAAAAKEAAAKERPNVSKISLKGGQLTYMGNVLPDKRIDVVLIGVGYWQKFYEGAFNPNVTVNPTCFAVQGGSGEGMVPHENVDEPISEDCTSCKFNQWKSDLRGGKGKACKEGRRLAIIPADALVSVEAATKAELAIIDVPPTSIKNYGNFVNSLAASVKRPMWAVITTLEVVPDPKTQFQLKFTPVNTIDDVDVIRAIKGRLEEAERACTIPYDEAYLQGESKDKDTYGQSQVSGRASKFKA